MTSLIASLLNLSEASHKTEDMARRAIKVFDRKFDTFYPDFDADKMDAYPEELLADTNTGDFYLRYVCDGAQRVFKINSLHISEISQSEIPDNVEDCSSVLADED